MEQSLEQPCYCDVRSCGKKKERAVYIFFLSITPNKFEKIY